MARRKIKRGEDEERGELNIVPYLDILMNLILFMLLSMAGLAAFGMVNVNAPLSPVQPHQGGPTEPPALMLTVGVAKAGFFIAASGAVLQVEGARAPTIPRKGDGTYDFDALTARMVEIKASFPAESKVIIAAEADTEYDALVATMDATRETADRKLLFPDVTIASF